MVEILHCSFCILFIFSHFIPFNYLWVIAVLLPLLLLPLHAPCIPLLLLSLFLLLPPVSSFNPCTPIASGLEPGTMHLATTAAVVAAAAAAFADFSCYCTFCYLMHGCCCVVDAQPLATFICC